LTWPITLLFNSHLKLRRSWLKLWEKIRMLRRQENRRKNCWPILTKSRLNLKGIFHRHHSRDFQINLLLFMESYNSFATPLFSEDGHTLFCILSTSISWQSWFSVNGLIINLRDGITTWLIFVILQVQLSMYSYGSNQRINFCLYCPLCMLTDVLHYLSALLETRWCSIRSITLLL